MGRLLVVYLGLLGVVVAAQAEPLEAKAVKITKVYAPVGFDNNDVVQVIVAGTFPSSCYKVGPTSWALEKDKDGKETRLVVDQKAYEYSDECQRMVVPYLQVVNVGIQRDGTYEVVDKESQKTLAKLEVGVAKKASADEFLYAPVQDFDVVLDKEGKPFVELRGYFSDRCTYFKKIIVGDAADGTIVVQPVVEHLTDASCRFERVPYLRRYALEKAPKRGTYLMHVRSMNGQALNKLVDLPARAR